MKRYVLYTVDTPERLQTRADAIAANLSKTKGRGDVSITVVQVEKFPKVGIASNKENQVVIDWNWFRRRLKKEDYEGVFFHFRPIERSRWGLAQEINGKRNENNLEYPEFYICCHHNQKAKGYDDLMEFERLMYHEHGHYDEDQDISLDQDSVHKTDYELKQIQYYHLLVDYRAKSLKERVNKLLQAVVTLAKKYI